ncbi:SEC-C domain-containing protein [Streptomyces odontomachi]|uniref:SEC-C domain-containing protein n=1 Tax=Streptomyces odontomachi TaxID=2944940 RepID=UPI00210CA243|nr:SEC-C domain-containing protein [Streptomyces sp. ODS25]
MRPDMPADDHADRIDPSDHIDHIAEAERLERTAGLYPEDTERLLLQAGAHLELAGARDRATALYDRLLSPEAPAELEQPQLVKALKAANLWEYGHEAEARAIIEGVRAAAPSNPAPWVIVAEALEAHDELDAAHETFTQAVALLVEAADASPVPETHPLLFGRHRVRRMLGADHDAWDLLADELHTAPVSLDELHDPKRIWALGSDNPAELRAEISRLRAELGAFRAALSRPFPVAVLHWPEDELHELVTAYPTLAAEYPSHQEHLATIESSLRELAASGTPNLGIVSATVPSYEAFAASESSTPADTSLLPQYATTLAARGLAVAWPPAEGDGCWCGSGETYGGCHGAR